MRTFVYPARLERGEKSGVLVVTFRDLPEAITQGNGEKDALWQASDCLDEVLAGRIADGREIPRDVQTEAGRPADSTAGANGCESGAVSGDARGWNH